MTEKELKREEYKKMLEARQKAETDAALPFIETLRNGDFILVEKNDNEDEDFGDIDNEENDDFEKIISNKATFNIYKGEAYYNKLRLNSESSDGKTKVYYHYLNGACQNIIYNEETKALRVFDVYEGEGNCDYWEEKNIFVFHGHEEIVLVSADDLAMRHMYTR